MLVFFYAATSGRSRRTEGFLAQVLQRRGNHNTFRIYRVEEAERPDLFERFGVNHTPTLMVVEGGSVQASLAEPRGCGEITELLSPWLSTGGVRSSPART